MLLEELKARVHALSIDDQIAMFASALLNNSDLIGAVFSLTSLVGVLSTHIDDELARVVVGRHLRYAAAWIDRQDEEAGVSLLH